MVKLNSCVTAVTGMGMISSIGHNVITSCASARAGITRASELDFKFLDEESEELVPEIVPIIGHSLTGVTDGTVSVGRLVRMGSSALSDLLTYAKIEDNDFSKTGFFVSLSNGYYLDAFEKKEREEMKDPGLEKVPFETEIRKEMLKQFLIPKITSLCGITIPKEFQALYFSNEVGIIHAIKDVTVLLQEGKLDRCILGGIDSYVEENILEALLEFDVIKTNRNPVGFIPGEAAAFIMIERFDKAVARKANIEAIIDSHATAYETCHRLSGEPSIGIALTTAITETFENLPDKGEETGLIIGNSNGSQFRANEWGNALTRLLYHYQIANIPEWYPALSFGEVGAAVGIISICMGVRGFVRKYTNTDNILIWISSDDGSKGALSLRNYKMPLLRGS